MAERTVALTVRRATADDVPAVTALLEAAGLPTAGLRDCIDTCFVAVDGEGDVVAAAGLEPHGEFALVRSVVVREDLRGTRAGDAVTRATLDLARGLSLRALYLFSMHAADFFARYGFVRKPHRQWPEAMRACSQYARVDEWDPDNRILTAMALEPFRQRL